MKYIWAIAWIILVSFLLRNAYQEYEENKLREMQALVDRSGAGRTPPPPKDPLLHLDSDADAVAGARLPPPESYAAQGDPASGSSFVVAPHETKTRAETYAEFSDEMMPTADGLYAHTVALWSDPEFLNLTAEEAYELFPLDPDLMYSGEIHLGDILGGLPTREDIDVALRDPHVTSSLRHACELAMDLAELVMIPKERQGPAHASVLESAEANWVQAEYHLMELLDEKTAYHNWTVLWRLYDQWRR